MKKLAMYGLGLVLLVGGIGCGGATTTKPSGDNKGGDGGDKKDSAAETTIKEMIASMNQVSEALEKKDVAAVKTAFPKYKEAAKAMAEMKEPSAEDIKKMDKYKEDMTKAQARLAKAMAGAKDKELIEAMSGK